MKNNPEKLFYKLRIEHPVTWGLLMILLMPVMLFISLAITIYAVTFDFFELAWTRYVIPVAAHESWMMNIPVLVYLWKNHLNLIYTCLFGGIEKTSNTK